MKKLHHAIAACGFLLLASPAFASQQLAVNNSNSLVPTTTPQLLLPSRGLTGNRQYLEIQNQDPAANVYIGTVPGSNGLLLKPGQDYSPAINIPGNAFYIWLGSGSATGPTIGWEG